MTIIPRKTIFTLMLIVLSTYCYSLPRFAVRINEKCQNCHIDPTGGGMRNYYGAAMYAKETLPVRAWADDSTLNNLTTQLNNVVSFGTDIRTILYYQQQNEVSSFYQMQGNIYLSARLGKNLLVYFSKGLYHGFEVFGMASILPLNGYIRAGRFTPAYGTKIDDHTVYIRDKTDFQNNRREDTGIEIGISPSMFTWNTGIFNGVKDADFSSGKIQLITTRADAKFQIEDFKFSLGGSAWYNNATAGTFTMFGGFGGASYKGFTLNTEIDLKKDNASRGTKEMISYLELNYLLIDGIDLKLMYDFYDPDIDYATGTASRYSFGVEFFPINGLEIRPLYRISKETPVDIRNNELDFLIHFYL